MNRALAALEHHFAMVFLEEGIEDTREHRAIVRVFCRSDAHVTEEELLERVRAQREGGATSPATVRHVMERLCEYGIANSVTTDDGGLRYEHLHLDQHHDHLICTRCKRIINFHDARLEELKQAVAMQRQFLPFRHRLEIYGLCNECIPRPLRLRPLTDAAPGETVRIVSLGSDGAGFAQRLADLGMVPEAEVQVVNNTGPIIVALGNTRIALGRGMAARILVE